MRLFKTLAKWAGLATMAFGAFTIMWALFVILQYKTGWGLSAVERAAGDDWAKAALGLLLSGMFFFLVGSGVVLVSRYEAPSARDADNTPPRWTRAITVLLFVSGCGSIGLATLFAGMTKEFGDATPGIVSYCMLIGVGLMFSAWGLKRAGDHDEKPQVR